MDRPEIPHNCSPTLVDEISKTYDVGEHIRVAFMASTVTGQQKTMVADMALTEHAAISLAKSIMRTVELRSAARGNIVNFQTGA